jgi:hypothetical protein
MADYIETIVHVRLCQVALKAPIDKERLSSS